MYRTYDYKYRTYDYKYRTYDYKYRTYDYKYRTYWQLIAPTRTIGVVTNGAAEAETLVIASRVLCGVAILYAFVTDPLNSPE